MSTNPVSAPSAPASTTSNAPSSTGSAGNAQSGHSGNQNPSGTGSVGNAPQTPPAAETTREYMINGEKVKLTQKEADEYVSMSGAARQKFREAAQMKKEFEERDQNYSKDPLKAFIDYAKKAGFNDDQIRDKIEEHYASQYIKRDQMTAEQRRIEELEAYQAKVESQRKQYEAAQAQEKEKREVESHVETLTEEIVSTLEASNLPKQNKFLLQRMAFYMHENNKNGWQAPKEMILKQVVNEHKGIVGSFLNEATMDQIVAYAGQGFIDKILKHSIEALRTNRNKRDEPFSTDSINQAPGPNDKVDYTEVNRRLRDMRSGKFTRAY